MRQRARPVVASEGTLTAPCLLPVRTGARGARPETRGAPASVCSGTAAQRERDSDRELATHDVAGLVNGGGGLVQVGAQVVDLVDDGRLDVAQRAVGAVERAVHRRDGLRALHVDNVADGGHRAGQRQQHLRRRRRRRRRARRGLRGAQGQMSPCAKRPPSSLGTKQSKRGAAAVAHAAWAAAPPGHPFPPRQARAQPRSTREAERSAARAPLSGAWASC